MPPKICTTSIRHLLTRSIFHHQGWLQLPCPLGLSIYFGLYDKGALVGRIAPHLRWFRLSRWGANQIRFCIQCETRAAIHLPFPSLLGGDIGMKETGRAGLLLPTEQPACENRFTLSGVAYVMPVRMSVSHHGSGFVQKFFDRFDQAA